MVKSNSDMKSIRKKLLAAVAMLLVASIMVVSSSYAWFTLSTAPEVKGIQTSVGANGNLEMALRYAKPINLIESTPSKVDFPTANEYWGNLVTLSDSDNDWYHLGDIALRPARLNGTLDTANMQQVTNPDKPAEKQWKSAADGSLYYAENKAAEDDTPVYARNVYKLATGGFLRTPVYGTDGRISALEPNTVNGIYADGAFDAKFTNKGVRAIGVTSNITPEALALRNAKLVVGNAISNTKSNATISLRDDSIKLAGIFVTNILNEGAMYTNDDVEDVETAITHLDAIIDELEAALRQAVVAVGVSQGQTYDPAKVVFGTTITVTDAAVQPDWSSDALKAAQEDLLVAYGKLAAMTKRLTDATTSLEGLTDDSHTFAEISSAVTTLLDQKDFLINGMTVTDFKAQDKFTMASAVFATPTISIIGGIYEVIAEFSGNYDATTSMMVKKGTYYGVELTEDKPITVKMVTAADETKMPKQEFHLPYVQIWMAGLVIEGGTPSELITDIYGYVIDLAFRTNATGSSLKLQTEAANRVNDSKATMGMGSYMQFGSGHADFTLKQVAELMQSIRVVFTNDDGTIYGVAALDVAVAATATAADAIETAKSYVTDLEGNQYELTAGELTEDNQIKANLYLYDYEIDAAGKMTLKSKSADSIITTLDQNVAKGVSAVVFLDGDKVENAHVATSGNSMTGTMNLQFSSSASLTPMNYSFQTEETGESTTTTTTTADGT